MLKELELRGNVQIFQMYSMRDKTTNLYTPTIDGNFNSMLHRIWNNKENIYNVTISTPTQEQCNPGELEKLNELVKSLFGDKVKLRPEYFYERSVGLTRLRFLDGKGLTVQQENLDLIICEYPTKIKCSHNTEIVYNYNWNAVDDSNDLLNKSLPLELELSKNNETFLFSDVQLNYWNQQTGSSSTYVRRSKNIFSNELFKILSDRTLQLDPRTVESVSSNLSAIREEENHKGYLFFPMRVDDPRYRFDQICQDAIRENRVLIITNPTKARFDEVENLDLIDLSDIEDKRSLYFAILKYLTENDRIIRYETDMHVSLIEQLALTTAVVQHNFSTIDTYIK